MLIRIDRSIGSPGATISNMLSKFIGGEKESTLCARLGEAQARGNMNIVQKVSIFFIDSIEKSHCKKAYRLYLKRKKEKEHGIS